MLTPCCVGGVLGHAHGRGVAQVNVNGSMFSNKGVEPLYVWMKKKAPGSLVNAIKWCVCCGGQCKWSLG